VLMVLHILMFFEGKWKHLYYREHESGLIKIALRQNCSLRIYLAYFRNEVIIYFSLNPLLFKQNIFELTGYWSNII